MDLRTYQEAALKTAKPTALHLDYLLPGLIAEIGECYGKIAKAERDGWDETRANKELASEWADCAWFAVVLAYVLEIDEDPKPCPIEAYNAPTTLSTLMDTALWIDRWLDLRDVTTGVQEVWQLLRDHCMAATTHTFDEVLEANLAKLADRANRGKIGGSGDER